VTEWWQDRLAELEKLPTGWLDGKGAALNPVCVAAARDVLASLESPPGVFPTPEGGVQLEWRGGLSLTFQPTGPEAFVHGQQLEVSDD